MSERAVLVADDDPDFRELVRLMVEGWGGEVLEARDFTHAVEVAQAQQARIGFVLLDYFMPGDREEGVRLLMDLLGAEALMLCTACGDAARRATELGLSQTIPKPIDLAVLERAVRRLVSEVL